MNDILIAIRKRWFYNLREIPLFSQTSLQRDVLIESGQLLCVFT